MELLSDSSRSTSPATFASSSALSGGSVGSSFGHTVASSFFPKAFCTAAVLVSQGTGLVLVETQEIKKATEIICVGAFFSVWLPLGVPTVLHTAHKKRKTAAS